MIIALDIWIFTLKFKLKLSSYLNIMSNENEMKLYLFYIILQAFNQMQW